MVPLSALSSSGPITTDHTGLIPASARATDKKYDEGGQPLPIVAICHLGWDGVWQRPQQLLSRFSQTRKVLFVETYCSPVAVSELRLRPAKGYSNVTIAEMHLPESRWQEGAFIDAERRRLLQTYQIQNPVFARPVLWFNDPMAVTAFACHCNEQGIVFDCMDELSQFKGAPAELLLREKELLVRADVVFCGGRKMRDKRLPLNPNCHFFGTGVDCELFGQARKSSLEVDPEIAALPGKVLGYFGVIDERIDYDLLAQLADAMPECSIAMVGPTAKVDPAEFPKRPNLHWLGRRAYEQLPAITKGFSVCLMPFAINAATEYINPTKALEYMATGRPIVSTSISEVRTNFGKVCHIAGSADEFVALCRKEAYQPDRSRIAEGIEMANTNTWESIVSQMDRLVQAAVEARRQAHASTRNVSPSTTKASHV